MYTGSACSTLELLLKLYITERCSNGTGVVGTGLRVLASTFQTVVSVVSQEIKQNYGNKMPVMF